MERGWGAGLPAWSALVSSLVGGTRLVVSSASSGPHNGWGQPLAWAAQSADSFHRRLWGSHVQLQAAGQEGGSEAGWRRSQKCLEHTGFKHQDQPSLHVVTGHSDSGCVGEVLGQGPGEFCGAHTIQGVLGQASAL